MQAIPTKSRTAEANSLRYRVVDHHEAGLFDSMTGATIWALKNLNGWEWEIEPVTGTVSQNSGASE